MSELMLEQHASYIIERVLRLGTMEDFRLLKSYYGTNRISEYVKDMRYLDDKVLYFCSIYFNIPISDFRCYTNRQLTHSHWQY